MLATSGITPLTALRQGRLCSLRGRYTRRQPICALPPFPFRNTKSRAQGAFYRHSATFNYYRQLLRFFRPDYSLDLLKRTIKHVFIKKNQRIECQILGACSNIPLDCQVAEKLRHLPLTHFGRVSLGMKKYEPADPKDISSLRIVTVLANPDGCSYLIENGERFLLFDIVHLLFSVYMRSIESVMQLYGNIPYNSLNMPNNASQSDTRTWLYDVVLYAVYCICDRAGVFVCGLSFAYYTETFRFLLWDYMECFHILNVELNRFAVAF